MLNFDLTPEKYKKLKDLYINAIYNDKKHFKFEGQIILTTFCKEIIKNYKPKK